jgi:hypothetical protein
MKSLGLVVMPETSHEPRKIQVIREQQLVATVFIDGEINFRQSVYPKDIEEITVISKHFMLFFDNIVKSKLV